ncbi:MAG: MBL fold metallo-hydrolase [Patescibacteria group bacterium]
MPLAIKISLSISIIFVCLSSVLALLKPDTYLEVIFCDVGQGDATLVQMGTWQLLIDGGADSSVLRCLDNHVPFWDQTIEIVLATHAHADHILGLALVMEKYHTSLIMTNGLSSETADFALFEEAIVKQLVNGSQHLVVGAGAQFSYKQLDMNIIAPEQPFGSISIEAETELWDINTQLSQKISDHNEPSIATFVTFGDFGLLVTGDMYEAGELALIKQHTITPTTILKAGHHGSKTSSSLPFLLATEPEIVTISAGKNNQHGHPAPEVLERVDLIGAQVARTDLEGELHFITDGNQVVRKIAD